MADASKELTALLTASIAAIVAVSVAIYTQFVLNRRETTKLLTLKLEELYLLTLKWQEEVTAIAAKLEWYARGKKISRDDLRVLREHRTLQQSVWKIGIYIELYFPPLRRFPVLCWNADRNFEIILSKLEAGEAVALRDVLQAKADVLKLLVPLHGEMGRNREALTKSKWFVPKYTRVELTNDPRPNADAVGTGITPRPPHRSVRAELPHTAPASGANDQTPPK